MVAPGDGWGVCICNSARHSCLCSFPPVGTGLGMFDTSAVVDLGLPKTTGEPVAVELSKTVGTVADDDKAVASKEPQKFSMGVTLPTVPVRVVNHILSGEFVDMGELSQIALRGEFKRSSKEEDQKSSRKLKFLPVADWDAWVVGFVKYAGVVCQTCPEKAVAYGVT